MRHKHLRRGLKGALIIGGLCALIPSVYGQGIGLKKLDEMLTPTQDKLARGELVYQRQCVTCHGAQGANGTEWARENGLEPGGFTDATYEHAGGLVQIYNLISKGQSEVEHPVYNYVPYQDRWAVSHYVHQLGPTQPADPLAVLEQAKFEAINGVCRDEIKSSISERVEPKGAEQLSKGKELYATNCASCHGEQGKGNGPAAAALQPAPRNFHATGVEWTNGTSPLAIFGTLANGIEGTSMASYANLTEEERWALTHYVRDWIPKSKRKESTEDQIVEVCRSLSAPAKPDPIPVEMAMKFIVEDAPTQRALERSKYGPIYKYEDADPARGEQLYMAQCASCHGERGNGSRPLGPYGAVPPYLSLDVSALRQEDAGGSFDAFARRSSQGVHATLPDMTPVAMLSEGDWRDIQSYVAGFDGEAEFISPSAAALLNQPSKRVMMTLDMQGQVTLGGELIELSALGERLEQERSEQSGKLEVVIQSPLELDPALATDVLGALKALGIESVVIQPLAPGAAPQKGEAGARGEQGADGASPEDAPQPEQPDAPQPEAAPPASPDE